MQREKRTDGNEKQDTKPVNQIIHRLFVSRETEKENSSCSFYSMLISTDNVKWKMKGRFVAFSCLACYFQGDSLCTALPNYKKVFTIWRWSDIIINGEMRR